MPSCKIGELAISFVVIGDGVIPDTVRLLSISFLSLLPIHFIIINIFSSQVINFILKVTIRIKFLNCELLLVQLHVRVCFRQGAIHRRTMSFSIV